MRFHKVGVWVFVLSTVVFSVVCFNLTEAEENSKKTSRGFDFFNDDLVETARRKKKKSKLFTSLVVGALLIKSIIFPLAFKAMAVMTSVAVLLSTMSLIISSIIGYAKFNFKPVVPTVKVVHVHDGWAKEDDLQKGYIAENPEYDSHGIPMGQINYIK